jgi:mannan endo-1,4-beta-mannosidase
MTGPRRRNLRTVVFLAIVMLALVGHLQAQFKDFITRRGDKLIEGDRQFRFISFNTPNLHYLEDYLPFSGTHPWRLPDEFEIRDALNTIKQLGGKVTRMYVLSVRREDDTPDIIRHVEGPGKFNEDTFRALDKVLQIADEVGIRVIIPFVDNWRWWGGAREYAAFRGKQKEAFWTDPELIADFKKTIEFVVNRTNTYTGTRYKDDKAIMAWETGNELQAPFSWTKDIAAYVKSLDSNHLLIEGTLAGELSQKAIDDPNLDILSTHHYRDPKVSLQYIVSNQMLAKGKKPYIIGEYGIVSTQDIRAITDTIIHQGLAGGMLWSLRFRNREGGFYNHYEYNKVLAYRWPGFPNGEFYDERMVLSIVREKAYEIDGSTQPRLPAPEKPTLLMFGDVSSISWQGSVGAQSYIIERKEKDSTEWKVIAEDADESRYQYRPLFNDQTAEVGKRYGYRIKARNESGVSDYSNVVGPVEVKTKTLVDEMESFDKVFQKDGDLRLLTFQDIRRAKEDRSRLTGNEGSYVIYKVPGTALALKVDAFRVSEGSEVHIGVDSSLNSFTDLRTKTEVSRFGSNDYGFFDAVSYVCDGFPRGARFIKILLNEGIQIARVEISYSPAVQLMLHK